MAYYEELCLLACGCPHEGLTSRRTGFCLFVLFFYFFKIFILFICAYIVWVISPGELFMQGFS
jgi:hypothetical protein